MSQSAAIFIESSSSSFFSPRFSRQFSSTTSSPGGGATSPASTQLAFTGAGTPRSSARRFATGASESSGLNSPSLGRPRWDVTITRAPASSACLIPGTAARIRVSSAMFPASSWGTLRSARMKTRLPCRSTSVMRRKAISASWRPRPRRALPLSRGLRRRGGRFHEGDRGVQHPVRKAPFVVIPGAHLDQRARGNLREGRIEDRGGRVVVEVDRDEWLLVVLEDALEVGLGGLLRGGVHLVDRRRPLGDEGEIDDRDVDRRHPDRGPVELAVQLRQ